MRCQFFFALLLSLWALAPEIMPASESQKLAVEIEIVADSSNHLRAHVEVAAGTNARELMEQLFKVEYLDAGRKFVVGIAGFNAPPRAKKFWKLEVDGVASQVGIAEIVITRAMRLRWIITAY